MEKQEIINSLNAGGKFTVSEDGRHIAFKTSGRRECWRNITRMCRYIGLRIGSPKSSRE